MEVTRLSCRILVEPIRFEILIFQSKKHVVNHMLIVAGFIFRRKGSLHRSLILSQGRTSYKVLCTVDFLFQNKQITMVIHNLNVWMRARYYKFCGHSHVTLLHNIVPSLVPRPIKIGLGMRLHCSMKTWQLYFLLSPHACEIGLAHETTLVSSE